MKPFVVSLSNHNGGVIPFKSFDTLSYAVASGREDERTIN
jgi:hypothetical protein